jgi:dihydroorotate dehydrogenase (NAD+) catalytic subunit
MTAAGCGGPELAAYADLGALGAVVTRTVTLDAQAGAPMPRLVETPSVVLSATGQQNPGLQGFLATELPWYAQRQVRTVVSIGGTAPAEYGEIARRIGTAPGVSAVEVHLRVADRHRTGQVVRAVRENLPREIPVFVKLGAGGDVVESATAAAENGADAVVVTAGYPGLLIDPGTLRPVLGAGEGLLSGPAVHPLALRDVWDVHEALPHLPVVGAGGIRSGFDALSMLLAGACAVQLGSVLFGDPAAAGRVVDELTVELAHRGFDRPSDVVGRAHDPERSGR